MIQLPLAYTASQIAAALGCTPRGVRLRLQSTPATACLLADRAQVWRIGDLPKVVRSELDLRAAALGYRSADTLLAHPPQEAVNQEPVPEPAEVDKQAAARLREALLPTLESALADGACTLASLEKSGLDHYFRVTGRRISTRQWRRLVVRVIERDAGSKQWHRLELYISGHAARGPLKSAVTPDARAEIDWSPVVEALALCGDPSRPTRAEQETVWAAVFQQETVLRQRGSNSALVRSALCSYMWRTCRQWVSKTARGLDAKVRRLRQRFDAGLPLEDGRARRRGTKMAPPIPKEDVRRLAACATFNTGGRLNQAGRELARMGAESGLSAGTLEMLTDDTGAPRERIARRIADQVAPIVKAVTPYFLGRKAIDDATAPLDRDWSQVYVMEMVTADDTTLPVYFSWPDGRGGLTRMRGQFLMFVDCRSMRVLSWCLIPRTGYNAEEVSAGQVYVARKHCVPKAWYFERGLWKKSHKVKRTVPRGWLSTGSAAEIMGGWEKLGVRFIHATKARSKLAERVFGLLQDRMERIIGFCGRGPREADCPEESKQRFLDFDAGRNLNAILTFGQWSEQISQIVADYNATSHGSRAKVIPGMSPDAAFDAFVSREDPPIRLEKCWHLIASDKVPVKVGAHGIRLRGEVFYGETISQWRHQEVWAWWDPTHSGEVGVSLDERGRDMVFCKRMPKTHPDAGRFPDGSPQRTHFEESIQQQAGFNNWPKEEWRVMERDYKGKVRRELAPAIEAHVSSRIQAHRESQAAADRNGRRVVRDSSRFGGRLGLHPNLIDGSPEQAEQLRELDRIMHPSSQEDPEQ